MAFKTKIDAADKAFSEYIRKRDKACLRCGKPGTGESGIFGLQASHFQGRRKENTRFNEANVCALCAGCHFYFTSNPAEHYVFQIKRLGQEKVDELVLLSNTYVRKDRKAEAIYWKQKLLEQAQI